MERRGEGRASIVVQRRIEWSDTDASGRWHNSTAFRLIEVAETALFDRLGLLEETYGRVPRVHIAVDFKRLLSFREIVDASLEVVAVGRSSATYGFELATGGHTCVTGKVVVALVDADGRPEAWSERHRNLLLESGPQAPERLVVG